MGCRSAPSARASGERSTGSYAAGSSDGSSAGPASKRWTRSPASLSCLAAQPPLSPAPMTTASYELMEDLANRLADLIDLIHGERRADVEVNRSAEELGGTRTRR